LGDEIADLVLKATDGQDVRLRDYIGKKHLVLEFGAVT
jgi:peroxiredoxin